MTRYGWRTPIPVQLMAILLPADTPVTRGSELPLKVHCGPEVAAARAPVPVSPTATQDNKTTHSAVASLIERNRTILEPPCVSMPPLMAAALASLWHTGSPYSRSMAAQPADALQTKVAKTRTAGGHTLVYLSRALARSVTVCSRGPSICPCRGSIRLRRSRRPGPGLHRTQGLGWRHPYR